MKRIIILFFIFIFISHSLCAEEIERKEKIKEIKEEIQKEEGNQRQIIVGKRQEIKDLLKDIGVFKGQYLWLKYPISGLSGLTKVRLNDFGIKEDRYFSSIRFYVEVDNQETGIDFIYYNQPRNTTPQIKDAFYIKDPSSKVAKWGKRVLNAIREGKIFIGMTAEQARMAWGNPYEINTTTGSWGEHEQWVMQDSISSDYLYFKNGILTSIQQSK